MIVYIDWEIRNLFKKKKKKSLIVIPNSKLNPATIGFVSISQVSSPFQIQKIRRCQVGQVQGQS